MSNVSDRIHEHLLRHRVRKDSRQFQELVDQTAETSPGARSDLVALQRARGL